MSEQLQERNDPAPRSLTQASVGQVKNADPNRVYCMANPNDDQFGAPMKEAEGWQYLVAGDKERVIGGRPAGDGTKRVTVRGNYVMYRSKVEHEQYLADKHAVASRANAQARIKDEIVSVIDGDKKE